MKFTFTLPDSLPQMTVKQLLEEQLLIPRKIRHFLRIKKHILINQREVHWNETVNPGDVCQLTFDEEEQTVVEALLQQNDQQINMLSVRTNLSMARLMALLFELEMKGIIRTMAGGCYHLLEV